MRLAWKYLPALASAVSIGLISGCSAPITSYHDPINHASSQKVGPAALEGYYYLPRTILTVEVKAVTADSSPPRAGSGGGGTGSGTGTGGGTGTGTGTTGTGSQSSASTTVENITLTKQVEADPRARLLYRLEPSAFSDDVIQIDTDETGLLNSVSSDTTDRSGNIAIAGADLIFTIATRGAVNPFTKTLFTEPQTPLKVSFDPMNASEVALASSALLQRGYCLLYGSQVSRARVALASADRAVAIAQKAAADKDEKNLNSATKAAQVAMKSSYGQLLSICQSTTTSNGDGAESLEYANRNSGIYYRRPIPAPVAIYKLQDKNNSFQNVMQPSLLWAGNIPLFNKDELYRIDIERTAFVRNQTNIKFANGSLATIKLDKPSEVLAGSLIPVQILRIAFAIPLSGLGQETALANGRTAQVNAEANLRAAQTAASTTQLNAQTAALNAQAANINAQTSLIKLQAQNAGGSTVLVPQ